MELIISSPGKVILHGEHAVVYGKAAIAASLNLRSFLRLTPTNDDTVVIDLPDIDIYKSWKISQLKDCITKTDCVQSPTDEVILQLKHFAGLNSNTSQTKFLAIVAFLYLYHAISRESGCMLSLNLKFASSLPVSAGLGSSAGYSVCLASALLTHMNMIKKPSQDQDGSLYSTWSKKDNEIINHWAFFGEKIIHGNPSGIDNSVATFGGAIMFKKGQITPLTSMPQLPVLLTNTRVPRSTKILVAGVRDKYEKYPDIMQPVMDSVEAITERSQKVYADLAVHADNADSYTTLEELIDINQYHLCIMGVSHPALEKICQVSSKYKLHSKLTGAGGGGCGYTLVPPGTPPTHVQAVMLELEDMGYNCFDTSIGGCGVCVHHKLDDKFTIPPNFI